MPDEYDRLADRFRRLARDQARQASPPVDRGKVVKTDPLVIDLMGIDVRIEEGDPDVEIDRDVLAERPDVGATVRVHRDRHDDFMVTGVIE